MKTGLRKRSNCTSILPCVDCALCVAECPVLAIFAEADVPEEWRGFIEKNANHYR